MSVHDLLHFDKVSRSSLLVDSSSQVARACIVSRSASHKQERKFISSILKVLEVDAAVNDGQNPFLSLNNFVELSYQKVIPHHLIFPWFVLLDGARIFTLEEIMRINISIISLGIKLFEVGWLVETWDLCVFLSDFAHDVFL